MGGDPNRRRDEGVQRLHLGRLAWVPIPVLLVAMGVFWAADWQGSHESIYLLLTLNLVFSLLVCLVVAYLISRSFLVRSAPGLLLLGCGVAIWGPAGVVATAAARGDTNLSITILPACGCPPVPPGGRSLLRPGGPVSAGAWLLAGGFSPSAWLMVTPALAGWLAFCRGPGRTPVRQGSYDLAIAMFALTALLLSVRRQPMSASQVR
jgi:hypothetical protein